MHHRCESWPITATFFGLVRIKNTSLERRVSGNTLWKSALEINLFCVEGRKRVGVPGGREGGEGGGEKLKLHFKSST